MNLYAGHPESEELLSEVRKFAIRLKFFQPLCREAIKYFWLLFSLKVLKMMLSILAEQFQLMISFSRLEIDKPTQTDQRNQFQEIENA